MVVSLQLSCWCNSTPLPLDSHTSATLQGGIMGVLLYGTVDFTNCALITNWDWLISCVDVAWGTTGKRMVEEMYRIALGMHTALFGKT